MFEEELRQAVINSGIDAYEIAKRAAARGDKISHQAVKRFMDRKTPDSAYARPESADVLDLAVIQRGDPAPWAEAPDFREQAVEIAWRLFQRVGHTQLEAIRGRNGQRLTPWLTWSSRATTD